LKNILIDTPFPWILHPMMVVKLAFKNLLMHYVHNSITFY
jgi:hypothetical protein